MEFNLPLLTIMRQQLDVYIKACNDTQNEIINQVIAYLNPRGFCDVAPF